VRDNFGEVVLNAIIDHPAQRARVRGA